jgi:hypothetical protein
LISCGPSGSNVRKVSPVVGLIVAIATIQATSGARQAPEFPTVWTQPFLTGSE